MATAANTSEADLRVIEKYSPVTGEKLGEYHISTPEEVEEAVARARKAFPAWRDLSLEARMKYMRKVAEVVSEDADYLCARISEDTGKPLFGALLTELMTIPLFIEHYEKTAPKVLARKKVKNPLLLSTKKSYIEYFPMGVIGIISPWNFPFQLAMLPAISALMTGNTVVLKPSEVTPISGEIVAEVFDRAGLPEGVFNLVQGDGSTGAALVECDIDKVFFTGSVATGRKVMAAAAKKPIPVELELGGKDAFIVCHDADLKRAAKAAAWAGLANCGQMCTSVERILVVESVHDEFVKHLQEVVSEVRVGAPDEDVEMGPMTFPKQLDTVEAHIKQAKEAGAEVVLGGHRIDRDGQFFSPTIVTNVKDDMDIYVEETFGPVLPVIKVKDEEQAIRMANDHQYGLTGSVWTKDIKRGLKLASRMESGQCSVNDAVQSVGNPALPFGGVKASGIGRYHGDEGLLSFMHQKAIMVDYGMMGPEPFWFPYKGKYPELMGAFKSLMKGNIPKSMYKLLTMPKKSK